MTAGSVLGITTSTGEALTTAVVAVFFALMAWAGFHRGRTSLGWFYVVATGLAVVLTVLSAAGHVFHGW